MKKSLVANVLIALVTILTCGLALASPVELKNCRSDIVTEDFFSCPGAGEGGGSGLCGSTQTVLGAVTADLSVDSAEGKTSARIVYQIASGKSIASATQCALGADHWMSCVSEKAFPGVGHLEITFNIDGIAPGVYFADIFGDDVEVNGVKKATNVPLGGFQNTSTACQSN